MKLRTIINFLWILIIFLLGFASASYYSSLKETDYEIKNVSDCSNKSLKETSYCLRDWVKTFYNYTITDDSINLRLDELKERGGDCRDYTKLYKQIFEDYGFLTKEVSIYPEKGNGHVFLIVWDKEMKDYCKVDMLYVNCIKFEK